MNRYFRKKWFQWFAFFFLSTLILPAHSEQGDSSYPFSEKWQPLYDMCMEKFTLAPSIVQMKSIDKKTLSPDDVAELERIINGIDTFSTQQCSCICNKAEKGFKTAGYDISSFEINLIAYHFKFETLYYDKEVRELFGYSVMPCMEIKPNL